MEPRVPLARGSPHVAPIPSARAPPEPAREGASRLDTLPVRVFYGPLFKLSEVHVMLLLALSLGSGTAEAAGFQAKTMRAPLAAVEVERPLILGRGWLEFGVGMDYKQAGGCWIGEGESCVYETGAWGDDGAVDGFEDARWTYTTQRLDVRYGISRRAEIYWNVPFHYVQLQNEKLGTDTSDFGIGDPRFGWKLEWVRKDAPTSSVVTDLQFKLPAGSESPGTFIGGPNTVSGFILSTGTMDAALYLRGKQQFGPFALTGSVGYVHRFSGVTQFAVETENHYFLGRFKPGSETQVAIEPMVQAGPVAVSAEVLYRLRMASMTGTTSPGIYTDAYLVPIEGTDGWSLDVTPAVTVAVSRGVDIRAALGIPLRGEDLLFPLEEITPTRGITYSGTVEFRY